MCYINKNNYLCFVILKFVLICNQMVTGGQEVIRILDETGVKLFPYSTSKLFDYFNNSALFLLPYIVDSCIVSFRYTVI